MSYEDQKLIHDLSGLVRRALNQGAVPYELRFSPDLLRKYDKVVADHYLPPRDKKNPKPFLRLKDAPSIPFMADRSLKPMTVVLLTDKNIEGIAVDLSAIKMIDKGVTLAPPPPKPSTWQSIKERTRRLFS